MYIISMYTVVRLFSNVAVFEQLGFRPKKLSWNCISSRTDFGNQLTAKNVMNSYLSKNNNKEYGSISFVYMFVEYSILHSIE